MHVHVHMAHHRARACCTCPSWQPFFNSDATSSAGWLAAFKGEVRLAGFSEALLKFVIKSQYDEEVRTNDRFGRALLPAASLAAAVSLAARSAVWLSLSALRPLSIVHLPIMVALRGVLRRES